MKKILVPTDFSENANKALNVAVQMAKLAKAEIILIHALETVNPGEEKAIAAEKMGLTVKSITETEAVKITTEVIGDSTVNSTLDATARHTPDLIIMGTVGNTGFTEKVFGSRTAALIGKSPVPVLAVPLLSEWKIPKKILLAINKFDIPERLLNPVVALASLFNSSIQATIFTDTDDDYVEDYDVHEEKIANFRDSLKDKYPGLEIHAVHLAGQHFRKSLQGWIDNNNIDILVMLTHRRTLIGTLFNSSMTKKMSYHTNIPLLAIPDIS
ncbi:MAG: universal stress protein [Chitinophagaceae bacterium]